ncbi:MAG: site-specific DNA-methyltransferase [Chloroflexi bacterium]|nr:site-specific DNA-methyltransferase [Chloroflexota bacterium]
MDGQSLNLTAEKIAQLRALFPEVFAENKIDFARLKDVLGETAAFPNEHYELSWAGKAEARKEIQKQTTATLIPAANDTNLRETEIGGDSRNSRHEHIFIEGENLQVLRILLKSYFGKVKMIYIDPPYNTGNDSFVYPDDYAERQDEYKKRAGITDSAGYLNKQDLWRKNSRENGQFHSVWLSMMYPRLYVARNLLREDGVIFVSIDDNEQANLKLLMDEIFGEENFIGKITIQSNPRGRQSEQFLATLHDYIFLYAKSIRDCEIAGQSLTEDQLKEFKQYRKTHFLTKQGSHAHCLYPTKERAAHENPKDIIPYDADDISL